MDKLSYAFGILLAQETMRMGVDGLKLDDVTDSLRSMLEGKQLKMSLREAQTTLNEYFSHREEQEQAKGKANKEAGEKYLAENKKKEGVIETSSGLQYKVLQEGTGRQPKATDSVKCHYEGFLIDGTVFDSSVQRGEPATFPLQGVIAGWTEGLQLMKEGAKYRFFIPYRLAYGEGGAGGSIPPYATLVFDVELIEVQ